MLSIEKKLLDFVQKHIAVLGIACLLLVSAVIRYFLLPYHSIDYVASLEVWYENFRSFGGWRALARDVGNYNMLYRTLMATKFACRPGAHVQPRAGRPPLQALQCFFCPLW